jgi:hypothetical protein
MNEQQQFLQLLQQRRAGELAGYGAIRWREHWSDTENLDHWYWVGRLYRIVELSYRDFVDHVTNPPPWWWLSYRSYWSRRVHHPRPTSFRQHGVARKTNRRVRWKVDKHQSKWPRGVPRTGRRETARRHRRWLRQQPVERLEQIGDEYRRFRGAVQMSYW